MEELVKEGLVKSIGVSNFTINEINDLLSYCKIEPAVNQVELHPYRTNESLIKHCNRYGIHIQAYSPIGSGSNILEDNLLKELAKKYYKVSN